MNNNDTNVLLKADVLSTQFIDTINEAKLPPGAVVGIGGVLIASALEQVLKQDRAIIVLEAVTDLIAHAIEEHHNENI